MDQLKQFIERIDTDDELSEKMEELSMGDSGDEKIIALAADYGFNITADELKQQRSSTVNLQESGKLSEEDLDNVVGGFMTNRWDSNACAKWGRVRFKCLGFFSLFHCSNYSREKLSHGRNLRSEVGSSRQHKMYRHKCAMGAFDYEGDIDGYKHYDGL